MKPEFQAWPKIPRCMKMKKVKASIEEDTKQCPCHKLILPRWDIYICDRCGRQLASHPMPVFPSLSIIQRIFIKIKRFIKQYFKES